MNYQRNENYFDIEDGEFTFSGERTDPYGFWTIKGKKGKQRIPFDSQYTSAEDAIRAVKKRIRDLSVA